MRGTGNNRIRTMDAVSGSEEDSDDEILNLYVLKEKQTPPLMTDIRIGGKDVPMEIDTGGASLTVMSKKTFDEVFSELVLHCRVPVRGRRGTITHRI